MDRYCTGGTSIGTDTSIGMYKWCIGGVQVVYRWYISITIYRMGGGVVQALGETKTAKQLNLPYLLIA